MRITYVGGRSSITPIDDDGWTTRSLGRCNSKSSESPTYLWFFLIESIPKYIY
jgi:hypothetical protein